MVLLCSSKRYLSMSSNVMKKMKKVPPKNFSELYLRGTSAFIHRQLSDPYVKKRRMENYRCRSAYKLIEIDDRFQFLRPASIILDLGASPGSWSQVAKERMENENGLIVAIDLLHFPPLEGVHFIKGNFMDDVIPQKIHKLTYEYSSSYGVDVVLCDAAPKASGIKAVDQDAIVSIATSAVSVAFQHLKPDGSLLFKVFSGNNSGTLVKNLQPYFNQIRSIKPHASRQESSEYYVLCLKYRKMCR